MKYLLDTHTFLWFVGGIEKISLKVTELIINSNNQKFISIASIWELSIKISLKKIEIEESLIDFVKSECEKNGFDLLNINLDHLNRLCNLPFHHKDPFDRLIISQALTENIPIISSDEVFEKYKVKMIW
ncbi:MAG: type II toxin-antitoxin system VapC family toxin [Ignavibacteria bacterium]|nr:type II toxin-antitoxin system VapC family toxin [Ignavibacteria bacterium]